MRRHVIVGIVLVLLVALPGTVSAATPAASAASPQAARVWLERTIEARDIGLRRPSGIAYQTQPRRLVVADEATARGTLVRSITLAETVRGSSLLGPGSRDISFDPLTGRVISLDPAGSRLLGAASADGSGAAGATIAGLTAPEGFAIGSRGGKAYVLDSGRIARLERAANGSFTGKATTVVRIKGSLALTASALAIGPSGGFYVLDAAAARVYRLDRQGRAATVTDLRRAGAVRPRAIVFAPSGDNTDARTEMSLYVADAGRLLKGRRVGAGIREFTFIRPVRARISSIGGASLTIIDTTSTAAWNPNSPSPSGIDYNADLDRLAMVDGEVDETIGGFTWFAGANGFISTADGSLESTFDTTAWNNEAVGLAYDAANDRYFISNDSQKLVWEIHPGANLTFFDGDDVRTSFSTSAFGNLDPEGVGYGNGRVFISDGTGKELYRVDPGLNGAFDGVPPNGDDVVDSWDLEVFGSRDPEGIDFAGDLGANGNLLIVDRIGGSMFEVTQGGALVRTFSTTGLGGLNYGGLGYGPRSTDPTQNSIYLAVRGVDNNDVPTENDGKIIEAAITGNGPSGPNLLANPGFETDADGDGPDAWTEDINFTRSSASVHTGAFSGRHRSTLNVGYKVYQDVAGVIPGTSYSLHGFVNAQTGADAYTIKIRIQWRDASNASISSVTIKKYNAPTSGWVSFEGSAVAPAGAATARILMVLSSLNGDVFVDDFEFHTP